MSSATQSEQPRYCWGYVHDISGSRRRTECVSEKKVVPVYSFTMYNHLVYFDRCITDGNSPEAVCQEKMSEDGFSLYAMPAAVLGLCIKSIRKHRSHN